MILRKFFLYLFFIALVSCSSSDRPVGKTEAEILYREASELVEDSRYLLATEKLNTIRGQYPYSYYATLAELLQADILFDQESFVESAAAYLLFKDFHPKHKKIPYVIWKIAQSYYNQRPPTYDRDLSACHQAKKFYGIILRDYNKSKFSKGAKEKVIECDTMLANKEKYIADFYYKTDVYESARYRYLDILENFSGSKLRDHSMIRVVQASEKMDKVDDCKKYYKKFGPLISSSQKEYLVNAYKDCIKK